MDDLVTWLREQIAEDRRRAKAATGRDNDWWWDKPESPAEEHIARWDPVRVLAECDAKEQVIAMYLLDKQRLETRAFSSPAEGYMFSGNEATGFTVLRILALPYADRPGYRDVWRSDVP